MNRRRDESGFRHNLRVRLGPTGPPGKLLHCERRDGSGKYWKVRLDSGAWVWPDGIVIDGRGNSVSRCLECRLEFLGDPGDLLCTPCQNERFGTTRQRAVDARDDSFQRARLAHSPLRKRSHS